MDRRTLIKQFGALAVVGALPGTVLAQREDQYQTLPNPIPPENEGRIEVVEFFHYGCPHCRNFHPLIKHWRQSVPEDVDFRAVPAIWGNEQLRGLARLYYTALRTETLELIEESIFAAVQDERRPIFNEAGLRDWIKRFDIDETAFFETYNSFAMQTLVQRADQVARAYRIQGVPTMAVGGRYITSASITGSHERTLQVVDQLIERVREAA